MTDLRLQFCKSVVEFSYFRISARINASLPDFPTSKKRRAQAAHTLWKSKYASKPGSEFALFSEYVLLLSGENTQTIPDLVCEVCSAADAPSPARMLLGTHLLQLDSLASDTKKQIMQRLLDALSRDLESRRPPLCVSVHVAQVLLAAYNSRATKLLWVPDQIAHVFALASLASTREVYANDLATAISKSAYRLEREITTKALVVAETNSQVAQVLAGKRWRTLNSDQRRSLVNALLRHASTSVEAANILGGRRWSSVPHELRRGLIEILTTHAEKMPTSIGVLAGQLWDFLDYTQRKQTLTLLLKHSGERRDSLTIAVKHRWQDLDQTQRSSLLEVLGQQALTDEIVAIVALKERWDDLDSYRPAILEYLIRRSHMSSQASVVLIRDLWNKLNVETKSRLKAGIADQIKAHPQVAIVASKSEIFGEHRQKVLEALFKHSERNVEVATVLAQDFWQELDETKQEIVAANLLQLSKTNSSAAVTLGTHLADTLKLDHNRRLDLVNDLFEFSQKDWRASVVLAESFGFDLSTEQRKKIALQLYLLSRKNLQCAKAAKLLQDSLSKEHRLLLEVNLSEASGG
jgi:hypothetical protein